MSRTVTRQQINDCPDCMSQMSHTLVGACASVGIEHGKTTDRMLFEYLAGYHFNGHRTSADAPAR